MQCAVGANGRGGAYGRGVAYGGEGFMGGEGLMDGVVGEAELILQRRIQKKKATHSILIKPHPILIKAHPIFIKSIYKSGLYSIPDVCKCMQQFRMRVLVCSFIDTWY